MSLMVGFRSLSRKFNADVGGRGFTTATTTWVNLDNKRVARDLARHSSIGQLVQVGSFWKSDDGVVDFGGKVTVRATGLVLDVSAVNFTRGDGTTKGSGAAGTATVGAADATNPRIDTVVVDTTSGAYSVVAGTATAGANLVNRTGIGTLAANRIALAYVLVPATATNLTQDLVADVRP